jgi:hypothetical protein
MPGKLLRQQDIRSQYAHETFRVSRNWLETGKEQHVATIRQPLKGATIRGLPQSSVKFDWMVVFLEAWWVGGVFVDGWAHAHGKVDQSFFTPWHAVLYSGCFVNALFFANVVWRNHGKGYPWSRSVPRGYELAILGVGIFLVGGVLDLLWHLFFGIERSLSATLSPTHLMLAFGIFLAASGPWRAAWLRPPTQQPENLVQLLPVLVSLAYVLSIFTFFTQYANPIVNSWADKQTPQELQALGVASILLTTAILIGVVLLAVRRWRLPLGSFTIILTINLVLASVLANPSPPVLVVAVLAIINGLLIDALNLALKPAVERVTALRLFAIQMLHGIAWVVHLWVGSIVLAGVVGLLLSYLLVPLPVQQE